jgi:diaminopimelate epimerase
MSIAFTKMHGLGNDFVVIEALKHNFSLDSGQVRRLADRHFGIGFDQMLIVGPPSSDDMDFSYRIFNADGNEVEQCGNGARCFARFVYDRGLTEKRVIRVGTLGGTIVLHLLDDGRVRVNMGVPEFEPEKIPFHFDRQQLAYRIKVAGREIEIGAVSMGNPHAVQLVKDVDNTAVADTGPVIENHPLFPQRVNAGYMQIIEDHTMRLRVWERGSGETLACGTGACAAAVIGMIWGKVTSPVKVELRGGTLEIEWHGVGEPVYMTGPAAYVYEGTFEMELI